ncbi:hypothetical protein ACFQ4C_08725 [Larkinella insperata]|uniref:Uncharacterized protein n=1 Tax=Larkinella insperata TaxID=332158 RepID=A0ABW3QD06_9BACT
MPPISIHYAPATVADGSAGCAGEALAMKEFGQVAIGTQLQFFHDVLMGRAGRQQPHGNEVGSQLTFQVLGQRVISTISPDALAIMTTPAIPAGSTSDCF